LLRAVIEHPDDVPRRLVYADHLQQHGDPQGELIAIQCRLAADPHGPDHFALEDRSKGLIAEHGAAWAARLGEQVTKVTYKLGLAASAVTPITIGALDILDRAPIRDLGFSDDTDDDHTDVARAFAQDPRLARIELMATRIDWGEAGFTALTRSPYLRTLRALTISDHDAKAYAGVAIEHARLPALEVLSICGDYAGELGDVGVAALARAHLPALRDLGLFNVSCTHQAMEELAASVTITELRGLELGWGSYTPNQIGPRGAFAIANSHNFEHSKRLGLDFNYIADAGLASLARSPHLGALRSLSLRANDITDASLDELATNTGMPHLELLELSSNSAITAGGIAVLAASPRMATLTSLWLRQIALGPDAAIAIARAPHAAALRSLNLLACAIGDDGARALLEAPHLAGLVELQLSGNQISASLGAAIKARWPAAVVR